MDIYMGQMARDAMMPNRQIKRPRTVRAHIEAVTAGLLKFLREGGGNLGGREKDILDALKEVRVVLPRGALSCVFQCYRALGCPFLSQPDPKEGKECSREWQFDGGDALDPENPKHLAMLKATRTMRAISEFRKPTPLEDAPAAQELPAAGMAGAGATEQPTSATGAPSSADTRGDAEAAACEVGSEPALNRIILGMVCVLAQQFSVLHERLAAAERLAAQAVAGSPSPTPPLPASPPLPAVTCVASGVGPREHSPRNERGDDGPDNLEVPERGQEVLPAQGGIIEARPRGPPLPER